MYKAMDYVLFGLLGSIFFLLGVLAVPKSPKPDLLDKQMAEDLGWSCAVVAKEANDTLDSCASTCRIFRWNDTLLETCINSMNEEYHAEA